MQTSATLTEQDTMNDLLAMEKQIISSYTVGITEASCPDLRQTLTNSLIGSQQMQFEVFDTMRKQGWYQTKDAQEQDVTNAKNKYNGIKNQL
ncbi:MAG: spore coat protein [Clostridiales bacterium]|nr:spore coat protein [Clostridiales bacterium]